MSATMSKLFQWCRDRSVFTNPVRWAEAAVGTLPRFAFTCMFSVLFGVLAILGVRLLIRTVELRVQIGDAGRRFEQATFLMVCTAIAAGTMFWPTSSWYSLRRLLNEVKRQGEAGNNPLVPTPDERQGPAAPDQLR